MKLQLKHLAPYLPYGLKIEIASMDISLTMTVDDEMDSETISLTDAIENNHKPMLRPLDLTKPITVDGIEIVPIDTLNLMLGNNLEYRHGKYSMYIDGSWTNSYTELPYEIVEKLLSWHFDVFGLIEQGLAVELT